MAVAEADLDFKYELEKQTPIEAEGGSVKEVSAKPGDKQFKALAKLYPTPLHGGVGGASIRMKPGTMRELHWHGTAAEWAYMRKGNCRVTVIDGYGRWEIVDFGPGDVWYFPPGHGHSIQAFGDDDCHFILTFNDCYFSDFETFSITAWLSHTAKEILRQNLRLDKSILDQFPTTARYFAHGTPPGANPSPPVAGFQNATPLTHWFNLDAQHATPYEGGTRRLLTVREFPISKDMAGAVLTIEPGGLRELHWHPNADEWQYFIEGEAEGGIFASGDRHREFDFNAGDVGYVPRGYGHYIKNTGKTTCKVLTVFNSGEIEEVSLSGWLASNPASVLATNLGIKDQTAFNNLPKTPVVIAAQQGNPKQAGRKKK